MTGQIGLFFYLTSFWSPPAFFSLSEFTSPADDYQRLDFVLVERYSAELPKSQETFGLPSASRQVGVRPRILTVTRRNPNEVALRVLRRFSYTESDTFAQYEKLLSAYDVADWSEPFFNNRALFSDYYLTTRLPSSPEWESSEEAGAMTRAFKTLRELYADVRETFSNQPEEIGSDSIRG